MPWGNLRSPAKTELRPLLWKRWVQTGLSVNSFWFFSFLLVMRTFKIYPVSNFQTYNMVSLTVVTVGHLLLFSHQVVSDSLRPMDCSPPGPCVLGISQARILEWVAISSPRGSFPPRAQTSNFLHWQVGSWLLSPQGSPIPPYTDVIFYGADLFYN